MRYESSEYGSEYDAPSDKDGRRDSNERCVEMELAAHHYVSSNESPRIPKTPNANAVRAVTPLREKAKAAKSTASGGS